MRTEFGADATLPGVLMALASCQRPSDFSRPCSARFTDLAAISRLAGCMNAPANCRLIGRWRIVEADLWDRAHLDLCGPAKLPRRAAKSPSALWRPVSKSNTHATRSASTGPVAKKATKSMAKGPPNSSTTARSRSSLNTETATKLSSKRNGTLLQQPASAHVGRYGLYATRRRRHGIGVENGIGDRG
jgi:hypothetical protein